MKAGIPASVIGRTVDSGERILMEGENETALTSPGPDQLYAALERIL